MSHEFDEKRDLAQYFIMCYIASRQGLTKLGILRSERNLQGDYAEWLVSESFGLQLEPNTVQKGYDATDREGHTYQIKSRIVKTLQQSTAFNFARDETRFDYLIGVFFSPSFHVLGVVRVPYQAVRELGVQNANKFRFRWNRKTASDPRIEKLSWSGEPKVS